MEVKTYQEVFGTTLTTTVGSIYDIRVLEDMNLSEVEFELRIKEANF